MEDLGKVQYKIEHEWPIAKLLVRKCYHKMLAYHLGLYGIYLQDLDPIQKIGRNQRDKVFKPHIAIVRTQEPEDIILFIHDFPEYKISKIFKHGLYFEQMSHAYGLICNTVKNTLALCSGKTLRIKAADRKSKEITDEAYRIAVQFNEECGFDCKFDYDEYDYVLEFKRYNRPNNKFAVIAWLYGDDMPNHYTMEF